MPGLTNYLRNKLIDWYHRGQSFSPPATLYVRLCSTTPSASAAGTEISGTGYAAVPIASSTTAWAATNSDGSTANPSTGTSGTTSNNAVINFGTAGSSWGTVTHWEMWDGATTGNRHFYGEIVDAGGTPTPRSISSGDPVSFPISALRVLWQ
jgi:hypothetical protein